MACVSAPVKASAAGSAAASHGQALVAAPRLPLRAAAAAHRLASQPLGQHASPISSRRAVLLARATSGEAVPMMMMTRSPSGGVLAPALSPAEARRPGFEALLRALLAGMGAGILSELLHVGAAFTNYAAGSSTDMSSLYAALSPLYTLDHVAAVSTSLLFYVLEAAAMLALLRDHAGDAASAATALRSQVSLPKRMLPLRASSIKAALHTLLHGRKAPAATAAAGGGDASMLMARSSSSAMEQAANLSRSGSAGGLERASSGAETLPRPAPGGPPGPEGEEEGDVKRKAPRKVARPTITRGKVTTRPCARPATAPATKPGAARPGLSRREKELQDRKAYLKNFWYVAALSQNVKAGEPHRVDMLGRTVTLFRDEEGTVRCLDNVCPHRGAPLSDGWVKKVEGHGNCVVCPYHGWAFDKEGRLGEVPSNTGGASFPKRPLVEAYPVEERGGFVWLFFGDKSLPADARPPIPICEELEDPNWRAVYGELEFDAEHHSTFENAIDMAHIHYLHDGSFGNQDKPEIKDMKVETHDWHISANFKIHNKPPNALWQWTATPAVPVEARAYLPSTSYVKITLGGGVQMITFVNTVPIDDKRSINRFCLIRNFAQWEGFDGFAEKSMMKILGEDKEMLDKLAPEMIRQEVSLEADLPQIAFRKMRQQWVDMGYGVDPTTTKGHAGSLQQ